MFAVEQKGFSNVFSLIKIIVFRFEFRSTLLPRVRHVAALLQ